MDYGKIREMKGDTILSPSVPRLGVRISPIYIYLGNLQYLDCGSQQVEEFIYLCPNSIGHVTRLLLVRFQGFLENSAGIYEYMSPQKKQIDNQDFAYEIEYFDLQDYLNESPDADIAHAADYIRQRSYTLAGDMVYQRFQRIVSDDNRRQFLIFYLEQGEDPSTTPTEDLFQRAMESFTIVH